MPNPTTHSRVEILKLRICQAYAERCGAPTLSSEIAAALGEPLWLVREVMRDMVLAGLLQEVSHA